PLPPGHTPFCDLRDHGDGVFLLPRARRGPAGRDRFAVLRGNRPARTRLFRRTVLAARNRARRHGRHAGRLCSVGLYAVPAELPRWHAGRLAIPAQRPLRDRDAAAAGAVRIRPATADTWRALVALAEHPDLCAAVALAPAVLDRTDAGGPVCA